MGFLCFAVSIMFVMLFINGWLQGISGLIVDKSGWTGGFILLIASCLLAAIVFAFTWNIRGQEVVKAH